jgi:hypothetical protein
MREEDYRDDLCSCGATLPEEVRPYSWQDHGFCSLACAVRSQGGIELAGPVAIDLATYGGRMGGPGFESWIVREWLKAAKPNAPAILRRVSAEADMVGGRRESWAWRLYAGGHCMGFRLTKKEVQA